MKARLVEIEQLMESCKHLSDLMFALASYRSSVSHVCIGILQVIGEKNGGSMHMLLFNIDSDHQ
jgi:hypothetical protein